MVSSNASVLHFLGYHLTYIFTIKTRVILAEASVEVTLKISTLPPSVPNMYCFPDITV